MCGLHKIALDYSKRFCSQIFCNMYQDYIFKFNCVGFPQGEILQRYQETMAQGELQALDEYRILMVNLMIGRQYKNEDHDFR